MKVIYVDDEELALKKFEVTAARLADITELHTFHSAEDALAFARESAFDAAFLDVEMPGMRGLELAQALKALNESLRIFFVTAYDQYALDAFGVDALGYLLKPYDLAALAREVEKAKRMRSVPKHTVYIQTVPTFDVYIDGELSPSPAPSLRSCSRCWWIATAARYPPGLRSRSCGRISPTTATPRRSTA